LKIRLPPACKPWFTRRPAETGLKTALAAALAYAFADLARLPSPVASVITVLFLMMAGFVGAVWEKSILRLVGTVIGVGIGWAVSGWWESAPWLVILVTGLMVGVGGWGWVRVWFPYAWMLMGMTTVLIVAQATIATDIWHLAVNRVLEITIGISVCLVVTRGVRPCYARDEFRRQLQDTMTLVGAGILSRLRRSEAEVHPESVIVDRLLKLGQLIGFGARESGYLAQHEMGFRRMLGEMQGLYEAMLTMGRIPLAESTYARWLKPWIEEVEEIFKEEFDAIGQRLPPSRKRLERMREVVTRVETQLMALRRSGETRVVPIEEVMDCTATFIGLKEVVSRLERMERLDDEIRRAPAGRRLLVEIAGLSSRAALMHGVKSAISGGSALMLLWLIGGEVMLLFPLAASLFTMLAFSIVGHAGDAWVWRRVGLWVAVAGGMIGLGIPLVAGMQAQPAFFWFVVLLGAWLFNSTVVVQGGISTAAMFGLFGYSGLLVLGAGEASSLGVAGYVASIWAGYIWSLLIQRLIAPHLPAEEVKQRLRRMLELARGMMDPLDQAERERIGGLLALAPSVLAPWLKAVRAVHRKEAALRWAEMARHIQQVAFLMPAATVMRELKLPEAVASQLPALVAPVYQEFEDAFDQVTESLDGNRYASNLQWAALEKLEDQVRDWRYAVLGSDDNQFDDWTMLMAAVGRLESASRLLEACLPPPKNGKRN